MPWTRTCSSCYICFHNYCICKSPIQLLKPVSELASMFVFTPVKLQQITKLRWMWNGMERKYGKLKECSATNWLWLIIFIKVNRRVSAFKSLQSRLLCIYHVPLGTSVSSRICTKNIRHADLLAVSEPPYSPIDKVYCHLKVGQFSPALYSNSIFVILWGP